MTIALSLVLFVAILFFEYIPILKSKEKKTKWVYGVFFVLSLTIIILHEMDINIPSPSKPIDYLFSSILKLK